MPEFQHQQPTPDPNDKQLAQSSLPARVVSPTEKTLAALGHALGLDRYNAELSSFRLVHPIGESSILLDTARQAFDAQMERRVHPAQADRALFLLGAWFLQGSSTHDIMAGGDPNQIDVYGIPLWLNAHEADIGVHAGLMILYAMREQEPNARREVYYLLKDLWGDTYARSYDVALSKGVPEPRYEFPKDLD